MLTISAGRFQIKSISTFVGRSVARRILYSTCTDLYLVALVTGQSRVKSHQSINPPMSTGIQTALPRQCRHIYSLAEIGMIYDAM